MAKFFCALLLNDHPLCRSPKSSAGPRPQRASEIAPRPQRKQNLQAVHITPGNHEWNSGEKFYGTTHSIFLKALFNEASDKQYRTTLHSNANFRAGTSHFKSHTAIAELAEHKVLAQHIMMEKGGKGNGGLPINQFFNMVTLAL